MDDRPGELDTASETEARGSEQGCPVRIYPLRRPEGHQVPVPRYSAVVPQQDKIAVLFMGVQSKDADALRGVPISDLLRAGGSVAPDNADQATFTDPQGYLNRVAALYWLKAADFAEWSKLPAVAEWRSLVAGNPSVGMWWEPVAVGADYMETIAFKEFLRGFSGCPVGFANTEGTGYWGAARDRIPAAAYDLFEPTAPEAEPEQGTSNIPYRKIQPPKNMTVIRSGVSWEHCEGEQLRDYEQRIRPALDAGMEYLRQNPRDTGCFALRQVGSVNPSGEDIAEGYSLGAFVSLGHLEAWAQDHPSHLAIYTRALAARRKYQEKLQLRTYNEIYIVNADNPPFEYFNCHPRTGLLPYARALENVGA